MLILSYFLSVHPSFTHKNHSFKVFLRWRCCRHLWLVFTTCTGTTALRRTSTHRMASRNSRIPPKPFKGKCILNLSIRFNQLWAVLYLLLLLLGVVTTSSSGPRKMSVLTVPPKDRTTKREKMETKNNKWKQRLFIINYTVIPHRLMRGVDGSKTCHVGYIKPSYSLTSTIFYGFKQYCPPELFRSVQIIPQCTPVHSYYEA